MMYIHGILHAPLVSIAVVKVFKIDASKEVQYSISLARRIKKYKVSLKCLNIWSPKRVACNGLLVKPALHSSTSYQFHHSTSLMLSCCFHR